MTHRILAPLFFLLFLVASPARAADDKADKLLGSWKMTKSDKQPEGTLINFTFNKDGTASTNVICKGGKQTVFAHTWRIVEGDQLQITTKANNREKIDIGTITRLDDEVLIVKDRNGKVEEFTRMK